MWRRASVAVNERILIKFSEVIHKNPRLMGHIIHIGTKERVAERRGEREEEEVKKRGNGRG